MITQNELIFNCCSCLFSAILTLSVNKSLSLMPLSYFFSVSIFSFSDANPRNIYYTPFKTSCFINEQENQLG